MSNCLKLISLAPTQTEIIAALGMLPRLSGVTEDCDYPEMVTSLPKFGSWYSPDMAAIVKAGPDLVFTFGSHQEEIAQTLKENGIGVYHSEPSTIAASLESMGEIAGLLGRETEWAQLSGLLRKRLERIGSTLISLNQHESLAKEGEHSESCTTPFRHPSVFRIMNWDPLITVGSGAFQHDVIEFSGGRNAAGNGSAPYYVCNPEEIAAEDPEIIFFCEPHIRNLLAGDPGWKNVSAVRHGRVYVYDCGLTCRSGPRIVDMAEKLNEAIMNLLYNSGVVGSKVCD